MAGSWRRRSEDTMWWDGDIPTPDTGQQGNTGSWLSLFIIVLLCLGLIIGLMLIGRDLFGDSPTTPIVPTPPENAP